MGTTKSKSKTKKFKGYKSYGEMVVKEAEKRIKEDERKGYSRFYENSIPAKQPISMDF